MNIIAYDPYLEDSVFEHHNVERVTDINEIARRSDIVTVHCPGGAETKNLINAEFLSHMKINGLLINTARGTVLDEEAAMNAVNERKIHFALDVLQGEPQLPTKSFKHRLQDVEKKEYVAVTAHIGASTLQAERACGEETLNIIRTFAATGTILHKVN
jgi:D-3-phosphoglycerate dehydrogenase